MAVSSLRAHLIAELTDLLDAETQLTKALPKMAALATAKPLKAAFQKHLQETRGHVSRLNRALQQLGERPRRKTCEGMQGLISEGEEVMKKAPEGAFTIGNGGAGARTEELKATLVDIQRSRAADPHKWVHKVF